jgi:hypothetical protein
MRHTSSLNRVRPCRRTNGDDHIVELRCEECGRTANDDAAGWQVHLARDGEEVELETVVFCPECASREFDIKVHASDD